MEDCSNISISELAKKLEYIANEVIEIHIYCPECYTSVYIHNKICDSIHKWALLHNLKSEREVRVPGYKRVSKTNQTERNGYVDIVVNNIPIEVDSAFRKKSIEKLTKYPANEKIWLLSNNKSLYKNKIILGTLDHILVIPILPYKNMNRAKR